MCSCFRHVSAKGNKCFCNRKSELTFAETHENIAEIWLFHVSADVFPIIATECVLEPAETQKKHLETDVCYMFPLLTSFELVQNYPPLAESKLFFLLLPETHPYYLLCALINSFTEDLDLL